MDGRGRHVQDARDPSRPELAANEAAFKSLLAVVLASQAKAEETASNEKIAAQIPQGQITIDSAKLGASGALGPTGAFSEHFEANGLPLPATLVPAPFVGFAPRSPRTRLSWPWRPPLCRLARNGSCSIRPISRRTS